jgi:hypothetical protein
VTVVSDGSVQEQCDGDENRGRGQSRHPHHLPADPPHPDLALTPLSQ